MVPLEALDLVWAVAGPVLYLLLLALRFDDWELLLIDDDSSDHTAQVMQLYSNDPRVRVFRTAGIGLPATLLRQLRDICGAHGAAYVLDGTA